MSTFTGHSPLHPLQARQRSSESLTASLFQSAGMTWPSDTSKSSRARPAARGVLFLARDHEARTHRAPVHAPAFADADAASDRAVDAAVIVGKLKVRRWRPLLEVGAESEVLGRV